jgi:hypothetical protein
MITATYEDDLARVRLRTAAPGVMNTNPWFESTALPWVAFGGAVARVTDQKHEGVASLKLTPDGVTATARTESEQITGVAPGNTRRASAWVRCPTARSVTIVINWFDGAGTYLSTSSVGGTYALAANTWQLVQVDGTAPALAARCSISINLDGTPPAIDVLYIDEAYMRTPAAAGAASIVIERTLNGVQWRGVRGGSDLALDQTFTNQLDDYEFEPGVSNTYRVRAFSPVGVQVASEQVALTPTIDRVWLKSIARPFLNRKIVVRDYSAVTRRSRAGLFEIPGRSFPVRVGDAASSRSWTLEVLTYDETESRSLEYLIESGDVVLVQVPPGYDIPAGYVGLGDMSRGRVSRALSDGRRQFSLPMTAVAAPPASVVGYAATWESLLAAFGTWDAVMAAFPTWGDMAEYVADPSIVVAP